MDNQLLLIDTLHEQPKPTMFQRTKTFFGQKSYQVATIAVVGATAMPAAQAGDFTLDTSSIMTAVGVVLVGVTAVALGALAIPLVIKGVKYLKAAF